MGEADLDALWRHGAGGRGGEAGTDAAPPGPPMTQASATLAHSSAAAVSQTHFPCKTGEQQRKPPRPEWVSSPKNVSVHELAPTIRRFAARAEQEDDGETKSR